MKLFNSKTQSMEAFTLRGNEVTLYVCGITPYDTTHLGHAFTYANYDILIRYLALKGVQVKYAQNVTDIDDDILKKARETGEDWRELGSRWTHHFINDMIALNVRPPDYYPRATDVIPDIIDSVKALIHAGVGYVKNGSVYYAVDRFPAFGQLSHLAPDEMLAVANERGNHPEDPNKHDPIDFVLWQAQAPGEPAWDSPWGPGRPGWHIECSTMATKFLGTTIDVHGGGLDLCFPHHECEIAQVMPIRNQDVYVRFWMHSAMVGYQGEKMSKSLGNLVMVSDLLKTYSADGLRLYLSSHHYRDAWSYDEKDLQASQALADRLNEAAALQPGRESQSNKRSTYNPVELTNAFTEAMENDLGTPGAVSALTKLAQGILDAVREGQAVEDAQSALRTYGQVLGLTFGSNAPEAQIAMEWNAHKR